MTETDTAPGAQIGPTKPRGAAGELERGRLGTRKHRPLWLQITLGCSVILLVVLGILIGVGLVIHQKGTIVIKQS